MPHAVAVPLIVTLALLAGGAAADPGASIPYTPSATVRHQLQLLADQARLPIVTTQWPLPAAALSEALDALPADLPDALDAARAAIRQDLARAAHGGASLQLRNRRDALVGFGDSYTPGSNATVRSPILESDQGAPRFAAQVGLRLESDAQTVPGDFAGPWTSTRTALHADDSALVAQAFGINLQVFSHAAWWSPGWQSSLVLGNNAPQWLGVGLQRASVSPSHSPWLAWMGPWNLDFFVAAARDPRVVPQQPAGYLLNGMRFTFKPHPLLELGLTRTIQFSGEGRPQGWRAFSRAFAGRGINSDTPEQRADDPGDEIAGYDVRVLCGRSTRCAFYAQLMGVDEAGHLPSTFLSLFGAETWSEDGSQRWFAEYANTYCDGLPGRHLRPNCAYRKEEYMQGYTNGTRWVGASQGPDSRLLTLGWLSTDQERQLRLHIGRVGASPGSYVPAVTDPPHGRLFGVSARASYDWARAKITPALSWLRLAEGQSAGSHRTSDLQLGLTIEWPVP